MWPHVGCEIHQKSIKNLSKSIQNRSKIYQNRFNIGVGGCPGVSWGLLEPTWAVLGHLGRILEPFWGALGAIWEAFWGILGVNLGILRHLIGIFCFIFFFDPNFSNFGANLASTWPFLAPSWAHVRGFWSLCWAMLRHVEASWSISKPKYWELLRLLKTLKNHWFIGFWHFRFKNFRFLKCLGPLGVLNIHPKSTPNRCKSNGRGYGNHDAG